jgi:hypothetical protein
MSTTDDRRSCVSGVSRAKTARLSAGSHFAPMGSFAGSAIDENESVVSSPMVQNGK